MKLMGAIATDLGAERTSDPIILALIMQPIVRELSSAEANPSLPQENRSGEHTSETTQGTVYGFASNNTLSSYILNLI